MTSLSLCAPHDPAEMKRWSFSAGFVVGMHMLVLASAVAWAWYAQPDNPGTAAQSIMIDLETVVPTPDAQKLELPPGETMREAPPPTPEPEVEKKVEKEEIAPTPIQEKPVVVAPPEQKEKPKPVKDKPKPVVKKKPPVHSDTPAPRTSAPAMAAQAARASYNGMVSAHLRRFKNPAAASAQGVAMVSFTLGRGGNLTGSRLAGSSGSPALDAEAMAMIRRAQPYPAFLPEMRESSISFTVPVRFTR